MKTIRTRRNRWALGLVPLLIGGWIAGAAAPALAHSWVLGDIFVAISDGQYQQYSNSGTPGDLLQVGVQNHQTNGIFDGGFTAGCAINPTLGSPLTPQNVYTTVWQENKVVVANDGSTHTFTTVNTGAVSNGHPESVVFNSNGDFYVGLVDYTPGQFNLLKYDRFNNFVQGYVVPVIGARGVDAIDLAADQDNIYYTSEDTHVYRYTLSTGAHATFANGLTRAYGLRLLQGGNTFGPGGSAGFLMVADFRSIKILDSSGATVNTFASGPNRGWFAVSINAGGSQFFAADFYTGEVVKFNSTGGVISSFVANANPFRVNGLCVKGELTTGVVPFPSVGFFVVGDTSAGYPNFTGVPPTGNNVTFWGSSWNSVNTLSAGNGASNAFKGFAESSNPVTPGCGGTFTSGGGASTAPPNTLPPRVAVLVTDHLTSGGQVKATGTIKAIVLVDVTQGSYNGGAGGTGSGRIVQVVCKI